VNGTKPRKGSFVVTLDGNDRIVELLDMVRPFQPLKDLNIEDIVSTIVSSE
jgi:hypothetical protein